MTVLVDSDILIEVARGRNEAVIERWLTLARLSNRVLYSPVTAAELWSGARPAESDTLNNLFRTLICADIDDEVGRRAGAFLQKFRRSHHVEIADAFIAASAVAHNALLWTRNKKHYPMQEVSFFD